MSGNRDEFDLGSPILLSGGVIIALTTHRKNWEKEEETWKKKKKEKVKLVKSVEIKKGK